MVLGEPARCLSQPPANNASVTSPCDTKTKLPDTDSLSVCRVHNANRAEGPTTSLVTQRAPVSGWAALPPACAPLLGSVSPPRQPGPDGALRKQGRWRGGGGAGRLEGAGRHPHACCGTHPPTCELLRRVSRPDPHAGRVPSCRQVSPRPTLHPPPPLPRGARLPRRAVRSELVDSPPRAAPRCCKHAPRGQRVHTSPTHTRAHVFLTKTRVFFKLLPVPGEREKRQEAPTVPHLPSGGCAATWQDTVLVPVAPP